MNSGLSTITFKVTKLLYVTVVLLLAIAVDGCAAAPTGPRFGWADAPSPNRGRVYLYRNDQRSSLAVVRTTIDGDELRVFRNREYETFEISAGSHKLRAQMRGLGFFSLGWNDHTFRVRPGEVIFLRLDVRLDAARGLELGGPRELEVAGRSNQSASENIFIGEQSEAKAAVELETTTRLPRPN